MDWDALADLRDSGVELGAHTSMHPKLTSLGDKALAQELANPIDVMEDRLGIRPSSFAYPYGDLDTRVRERARSLYEISVTTRLAPMADREDPADLPRLDMYYLRDRGRLEGWGSASFHAYLKGRRALRGLRSLIVGGAR